MWNIKTTIVPVVVEPLGMVTDNLPIPLAIFGVTIKTQLLQKVALLGTVRLRREVLEP